MGKMDDLRRLREAQAQRQPMKSAADIQVLPVPVRGRKQTALNAVVGAVCPACGQPVKEKFDKTGYQREYMRRSRAKQKDKT